MTLFKVAELKDGHTNIEISGEIISVGEARSVVTRYGQETKVTNATLEDDTANILLVLWGDQAKGIVPGAKVKITGGFVKSWKGAKQLGVGRKGTLEVMTAKSLAKDEKAKRKKAKEVPIEDA